MTSWQNGLQFDASGNLMVVGAGPTTNTLAQIQQRILFSQYAKPDRDVGLVLPPKLYQGVLTGVDSGAQGLPWMYQQANSSLRNPNLVNFFGTVANNIVINTAACLVTVSAAYTSQITWTPSNINNAVANIFGGVYSNSYELPIRFRTDAPYLGLIVVQSAASGPGLTIKINGKPLTAARALQAFNANTSGVVYLAFPNREMRDYYICNSSGTYVSGLMLPYYETVAAPESVPLRIAFSGDSELQYGPTPDGQAGGPVFKIAERLDGDVFNGAVGGTGYFATSGGQNEIQRLPSLLQAFTNGPADMYFQCAGVNDSGGGASVQANIAAFYTQLRAGAPNALIVGGVQTGTNATLRSNLSANVLPYVLSAMKSISGPWIYIDGIAGSWQTSSGTSATTTPYFAGTGFNGSYAGSGNLDAFGADGTHLNGPGHIYYADRLWQDFRAAVLSM